MNKLIIYTRFPAAVAMLLKTHELVEGLPHLPEVGATIDLEVYYPDDAISQSLAFWFALAHGCGLINGYELKTPWMLREATVKYQSGQEVLEEKVL